MRTSFLALAVVGVAAFLSTGCAKTEKKLGRGVRNATEFVRFGEIQYSIEQTALFDSPDKAYSTGVMRGLNRALLRTGVGIYEIVTCPFPPYGPVMTDYLSVEPRYPDSYKPGMIADQSWSPDANLGFSGGEIFPMIPGSRFKVFEN